MEGAGENPWSYDRTVGGRASHELGCTRDDGQQSVVTNMGWGRCAVRWHERGEVFLGWSEGEWPRSSSDDHPRHLLGQLCLGCGNIDSFGEDSRRLLTAHKELTFPHSYLPNRVNTENWWNPTLHPGHICRGIWKMWLCPALQF